jgi:hypothetical protein
MNKMMLKSLTAYVNVQVEHFFRGRGTYGCRSIKTTAKPNEFANYT